jgi:hypothetical protein
VAAVDKDVERMQVAVTDDLAPGLPLAGDQEISRRHEITAPGPFCRTAQEGQHTRHAGRNAVEPGEIVPHRLRVDGVQRGHR